ncbi:hypothetical protein [Gordonia sp. NB41Y]|uniref:hypothetical protein n=1 Tax=Gordonia sp. NB41Y TaxID=875808 RepID=UPI0021C8E506|nr:hypothetical protein [Gordonia sp. NB41Y]WLP91945.1 hypothetical protein Q9K23_06790 [Gordonia sp. NB41Y]
MSTTDVPAPDIPDPDLRTPEAARTADTTETSEQDLRHVVGLVVGLTVLLGVLLLAFALPAVNTGAHGIQVGIVAPEPAAAQLESKADGFDFSRYDDADAARAAILDRKIYGAVVLTPGHEVDVLVATAASASAATAVQQMGEQVAAANGTTATVENVRSFPADDPRGAGLAAGALPMALGGWIGAVAILFTIRTTRHRLIAVGAFAVVGGLGLTATLQFVVGTLDGNYWLTSLGAVLGIAATAMTVLGLKSLFGGAGLGIAAVLLILLGNPLSGLTSAPEMLPTPWGTIGQMLPPGATGTLLRDLAFFDGAGITRPLLVLAGWLIGGSLLFWIATRREATTKSVPA